VIGETSLFLKEASTDDAIIRSINKQKLAEVLSHVFLDRSLFSGN